MLGIIGGTGLAKLADLEVTRREIARTPWGDPSCALTFGRLDGRPVVFLARHGYGHTIAPHDINYRANLWALRDAGVAGVVSVATVGGIGERCVPGAIVPPAAQPARAAERRGAARAARRAGERAIPSEGQIVGVKRDKVRGGFDTQPGAADPEQLPRLDLHAAGDLLFTDVRTVGALLIFEPERLAVVDQHRVLARYLAVIVQADVRALAPSDAAVYA